MTSSSWSSAPAIRRCAHDVRSLEAGADLVLTSIGALVDDGLRARLEAAAVDAGRRLTIASAGIGALDILAAAAVGGLTGAEMTVRKDPTAWYGTEVERLTVRTLVVRSPALHVWFSRHPPA